MTHRSELQATMSTARGRQAVMTPRRRRAARAVACVSACAPVRVPAWLSACVSAASMAGCLLVVLAGGPASAATPAPAAQERVDGGARVVATLFGQPQTAGELKLAAGEARAAAELRNRALKIALERFVLENRLEATEADFTAYARFEAEFQRHDRERRKRRLAELEAELGGPAALHLSEARRKPLEDERDTLRTLDRHDAERAARPPGDARRVWGPWISGFKAGKALYERYGGVVGITKFGPEPSGAIVALLRAHEQAGRLQIADPGLRAAFWSLVERPPRLPAKPGSVDFTYYWLKPVVRD
jgi:hypothetical protein